MQNAQNDERYLEIAKALSRLLDACYKFIYTSEKNKPVLTPVYSNDFIFESADHTKKK